MKHRTTVRPAGLLVAAALAGLVPLGARAQAMSDRWQWEAAVYAWLPSIGGTTSFPVNGSGGPNLDVNSQDVLDSLKMVFMGQVEARKGKWGLWTDLVYADLGASKSATRDYTVGPHAASVDANLGLDLKATAWTTAAVYNLASTPENSTDMVFGARMLNLQEKLDWSLASAIPELPARSGAASASERDWDAIIGLKGRYFLGAERRWFLPYYADVGAGQSKSTWQAYAGVGYRFNWGAVFASYRYLDYQFKSGQAVQSMTLSGGLVGVGFQW